ncbi:MAG: hypothetical protein A3C10_03105 [Candidatus Magasanikbacteria bacterium RIFCSPHIGHO2_02_FULL_48_18]|nr:MAG: hypothetical protein A3C10_03105 [Candidatus Magasanikbacteria bacterium RIFCSPHIGHO2_02_FULL_48_18]
MANPGVLRLKIRSAGGHVADPEHGSGALRGAVCAIWGLLSSQFNVVPEGQPFVLEPVQCQAGDGVVTNVLPSEATLVFNIRHFLVGDQRDLLQAAIEGVIRTSVAKVPGAEVADLSFQWGAPALHNTPEDVERVGALLGAQGLTVKEMAPILGAEDFSYFLGERPGSFWFFGAHTEGTGPIHSPTFVCNPKVLQGLIAYWLALATAP